MAASATNSMPLVLLVEDDLRLAELVRTYLQGNGFRVVVEHRGDRVVEHLQSTAPDLVVLDLNLPGLGGDRILSDVAATPDTRDIPVIVVTGADVDRATLQAAAILKKPVLPEHVFPLIDTHLRVA